MLEAYTNSAAVNAAAAVPFDNTLIQKGCTAVLSAPATVQLNKCGVYNVSFTANATTAATIALYKDGIQQAQTSRTAAAGGVVALDTLVQVSNNNCACNPCTAPTTIQIINTGTAAATLGAADIVVTKVC